MKRGRYVKPAPPPKTVPAPPKRTDILDIAGLNARVKDLETREDRTKQLEAKLARAREALVVARNFVERPWKWNTANALAVKRRLNLGSS